MCGTGTLTQGNRSNTNKTSSRSGWYAFFELFLDGRVAMRSPLSITTYHDLEVRTSFGDFPHSVVACCTYEMMPASLPWLIRTQRISSAVQAGPRAGRVSFFSDLAYTRIRTTMSIRFCAWLANLCWLILIQCTFDVLSARPGQVASTVRI